MFLVNVPIGLAALLPARRVLREARDPAAALPDVLGSALLVAGVAALALGIVKGPDWGWGSARVLRPSLRRPCCCRRWSCARPATARP